MKKKLLVIIITTLIAANLSAIDTKKTELVMRDHRMLAASHTTFNQLKRDDSTKGRLATKIQKTAFFKETQDASRLGEVFATKGRNWINIGNAASAGTGNVDVENNLILHHQANANVLAGKIFFNPKQTAYGIRVDTVFLLDNFFKGLYFKNNFVCKYVKHDLHTSVIDESRGATTAENLRLIDVLNGTTLTRVAAAADQQASLTFAKLTGALSRTGLEDIESCIGIRLINKGRYSGGINFAWITPTGDEGSKCEYLWEPRVGSNHWGIGGGVEGKAKLWSDPDQCIHLSVEANYRYLFKDTEKRTLGLKDMFTTNYYNQHILSHYYLLGRHGFRGLSPAANLLTQDVNVTPGSRIDAIACFNYKHNNLCIDLGYNIFWKDSESISLRSTFTENAVGISDQDYNANVAFLPADRRSGTPWINSDNIDTHVAETPSILTHTIFGGVGYMLKMFGLPVMLGVGGSYEIGDNRASADALSFWFKSGVTF